MEKLEQYSGSIMSRSIAQNHKFRRKASFKEPSKPSNSYSNRQQPFQQPQLTNQPTQTNQPSPAIHINHHNNQLAISEPPHRNPSINHISSLIKPSNGLSLPTTKNQQNQQQFSKIQNQQAKTFARRKSLSKQIKTAIKKGKEEILLKGQLKQNDSISTNQSHIQSTMFMTFQSSEKQFKRKNNASSSDKYIDSARLNNGQQQSGQNTLASNGGACFLPDIHINNNQLKQTPDPKKTSTKTQKQLALIDESTKNKFKSSDEDIHSYFNFKESQKFVSTSSTEPSDDQLLYKGLISNNNINTGTNSQLAKNRTTPKGIIGQSETRKNGANTTILSNQYTNKVSSIVENVNNIYQKSNLSAFDNYQNQITSPKTQVQTNNEQIILSLQQQFQISKAPFNYEDSSSLGQKSYKTHDLYANNAYQSPNIKGPKYQRKVSLEESITDNSLNPQSLVSSKDNFHMTAQLSSKINSAQLSKLQLAYCQDEHNLNYQIQPQATNPQKYKSSVNLEECKQSKLDDNITKRVLLSKQDIKLGSQKQGVKIQRVTKNVLRQSTEKYQFPPDEIAPFRQDLNYDQYLQPRTDCIYEFQSKRLDFRRRPSNKDSQIVIIHFDGLVGEINQKNLGDDSYQLVLRHGSVEGLQELSKNFQIAILTTLNQKYCRLLIELLDKEDIVFDGIYQRVKTFRRSDEHYNYNQIYIDFDIHNEGEEYSDKVQQNVIILAPIFMDNEDIRDKDGDDLLFQEKQLSMQVNRSLNFKGLPIDSKDKTPITLLIPHLRAHSCNYSVSMLNIGNIVQSLLFTSCQVKEDQPREVEIESYKDREYHLRMLREEECSNKNHSRSSSPKRSPSKTQSTLQQKGLFMMTITTISPKNHFKKILASTRDKILDQKSCNWLQAYYQVKKYKLFSLKTVTSMKPLPEFLQKRKEDDIIKLKQTIFKLKALYQSHIDKTNHQELLIKTPQTHELLINNDWVKQSIMQYKNEYYNNLAQLLQDQSQNPLKELIADLEERLLQIQNQTYSADYPKSEIPLYRFLVLQGHQFQNYPCETKMIIKEKETNLQRNLYNWVVQSTSYTVTSRNAQKKTFTNPLSVLNGREGSNQQSIQQDTHFMPGYRIFSDQYQ
ncbi:UNKNOWN [Stylonychia lemnae]|uniref:FCP1 homology domain-containing protein n=1 Tax=Stylonychia lemnae TaxID=5949 RepID=A0A078A9H5_STYLE|nr:UNKNOWN [Stylonychia lemnae]|eukprot:CDW78910.1 UNKNOWN [Stylonychia lemnae]